MTHSPSPSDLGSKYDGFLHATVVEGGNGMPLSVLSALARLDVDPWLQAADLASLPRPAAIERLSGMIAALPHEPSSPRDHASIATRLIALLPSGKGAGCASSGPSAAFDLRSTLRVILVNVLLVVFMLAAQWFVTGHQVRDPASGNIASATHKTGTEASRRLGQ